MAALESMLLRAAIRWLHRGENPFWIWWKCLCLEAVLSKRTLPNTGQKRIHAEKTPCLEEPTESQPVSAGWALSGL